MLNLKKIVAVAALGFALFTSNNAAKAQAMPDWGVGNLWAMNAQFDQQFDQWARVGAWQAALATPNDQPLPFNAMTISNSISAGNQAFYGYLGSVQANSASMSNTVGNYSTGAIQGNWYYTPQYGGGSYTLPYTTAPAGGYYMQNGYVYPGYQYGGNNMMMMGYR
jgi:hypothetical protein